MSAHATTVSAVPATALADRKRRHRIRITLAAAAVIALFLALSAYGWDYYTAPYVHRPLSPKHALLKPSGSIGLKLGMLGFGFFCGIFLYPLRKRVKWLSRRGNTKNWLDFHILMGLSAPVIIAFHSSFKFKGIAGMAFWIMFAVVASGVIGRYLYGQIPRKLNSVEMSLREAEADLQEMSSQLSNQKLFTAAELERVLQVPSPAQVQNRSLLHALAAMIALDVLRPFAIARLRRKWMSAGAVLLTFGGLLPTREPRVEQVIQTVRRRATLAKRAVFLERTQRVFHLWHVVHKPFSYSFAVLAALHIAVAMLFGFM